MGKIGALLAAILALAAPAAWAQAPAGAATGTVTARAYQALPPGAAIAVEPAQDTDQNQRLKTAIEALLRERGYRVVDNAQLVLEFYATEVTGSQIVERPGGGRALESPVPGTGQGFRTGALSSLNQDLFGKGSKRSGDGPSGVAPPPSQVHLSMMLTDRRAARRVWQGSASGELRRPDSFAATQSLVPFLVQKLGMTVGAERFELP